MSERRTGWPKGRIGWVIGTVVLLALGALVGAVLGNLVLGLAIGVVISIGWLIAYESWRGKTPGLNDPWDDGAQL
ncbi:hypothetical protein [Microbacterium immunditiarum]|uniref:Uncharacterized protein n=1 Tax=Microbacterium immunditiarum TaxID=337480 RepID=A0A7Y9GPE5_9MICO|nr:hypothetical protein [Microbacterium immunditiarum]NYE19100.1 hypothetical protein [Microbacterium immunditiarum]